VDSKQLIGLAKWRANMPRVSLLDYGHNIIDQYTSYLSLEYKLRFNWRALADRRINERCFLSAHSSKTDLVEKTLLASALEEHNDRLALTLAP
jgi:hypothetical protein